MLKPYRTIQDVLASHWVLSPPAERHQQTDRVLRSTKLESSIYRDLRAEDGNHAGRGEEAEVLSCTLAGCIPVLLLPCASAQ